MGPGLCALLLFLLIHGAQLSPHGLYEASQSEIPPPPHIDFTTLFLHGSLPLQD